MTTDRITTHVLDRADEDPTIRFRDSLRSFASGVTVVTVAEGESVHGMTASSFASVSLTPQLCAVSVNKPGKMHQLLIGTDDVYGISILAEDQSEIADYFARRPWATSADVSISRRLGAPVIEGALVWLACRKWASYDGGDHTIFVGEVLDHRATEMRDPAPLISHNSGFYGIGDRLPNGGSDN